MEHLDDMLAVELLVGKDAFVEIEVGDENEDGLKRLEVAHGVIIEDAIFVGGIRPDLESEEHWPTILLDSGEQVNTRDRRSIWHTEYRVVRDYADDYNKDNGFDE